MECTRTAFHHLHHLCLIAPTTTHQIAAIHSYRSVIALTIMCTLNAQTHVLLTKTGRLLQIDNILGAGSLVIGIVGLEDELISARKEKKVD